MMGLYRKAWEKLKALSHRPDHLTNQESQLKIIAPAFKHKRIVKAIKKKKWQDMKYKELNLARGKVAKLEHKILSDNEILFWLVINIGVEDI
jgi:hypothetical protein